MADVGTASSGYGDLALSAVWEGGFVWEAWVRGEGGCGDRDTPTGWAVCRYEMLCASCSTLLYLLAFLV